MKNIIAYALIRIGLYLNPKGIPKNDLDRANSQIDMLERIIKNDDFKSLNIIRNGLINNPKIDLGAINNTTSDDSLTAFNKAIYKKVLEDAENSRVRLDFTNSQIELLQNQSNVVYTGGKSYYFMPFWFENNHRDDYYYPHSLGNLPRELIDFLEEERNQEEVINDNNDSSAVEKEPNN